MCCGTVEGKHNYKINVKTCQQRISKDAERQKIKNKHVKSLDGRMITENEVMKKENWAG